MGEYADVPVKEGGTPRSCETPWKIASMGKRESARRSSPAPMPFPSGSGGVTKYRVLLPSFCCCRSTNSPSSRFSDSPKIVPAPSDTMNPSRRLRLLRSNWSSRPCKAQKTSTSSSQDKEWWIITLAQVQNVISERLGRVGYIVSSLGRDNDGRKKPHSTMPIISGTHAPWGIFFSDAPQKRPDRTSALAHTT